MASASTPPINTLFFDHKIGCLKIGNDFFESFSDSFVVVSEPKCPHTLWIYGHVDEGLIISQGRVLTRYLPDVFTRNFTSAVKVSDPTQRITIPNLQISSIYMGGSVSIIDIDPRAFNPTTGYKFCLHENSSAIFRLSTQRKTYFSLLQSASLIGKEGSELRDLNIYVSGPCRISGFTVTNCIEIDGDGTPVVDLKVTDNTYFIYDNSNGYFDTSNLSFWDIDTQSFRSVHRFDHSSESESEESEENNDEIPLEVLEESQQAHLDSVFPFTGTVDFTESFTLTDDQTSTLQPLFQIKGEIPSLCVPAIHHKDVICSICDENKATVIASCKCFITCNQCIVPFSRLHKTCPFCREEILYAIPSLVERDHKSFEITYLSSDRQDKLKTSETDLECDECKTNIPLITLSCGHKPWCISCTSKAQLKKAKCSKCHTLITSAILLPFLSSSSSKIFSQEI